MDIKAEPRSDQLNADDLIGGPVTVTIKEVIAGKAEQPYDFELVEYPGRAYRPNKTMLRVLIEAWGGDGKQYVGRRMTLYRDATVKFGPDTVGGIRISHLSHIDAPIKPLVTITRGRRKPYTVQPLIESDNPQPPSGWRDRVENAQTLDGLQKLYDEEAHAWFTPEVRLAFTARKKILETPL